METRFFQSLRLAVRIVTSTGLKIGNGTKVEIECEIKMKFGSVKIGTRSRRGWSKWKARQGSKSRKEPESESKAVPLSILLLVEIKNGTGVEISSVYNFSIATVVIRRARHACPEHTYENKEVHGVDSSVFLAFVVLTTTINNAVHYQQFRSSSTLPFAINNAIRHQRCDDNVRDGPFDVLSGAWSQSFDLTQIYL
ncbi:hypothetical protein EVAR_14616_1 [Eumeta japonica]|uniref:Uncharacterized protein n=1 Tax=Eumeta variegata TaxID=151549 RepID=A0A4C1UVQ2_EUMVA|nr:hypothetical protein EVAR_14616_1 [Eumeta japonica]